MMLFCFALGFLLFVWFFVVFVRFVCWFFVGFCFCFVSSFINKKDAFCKYII